MTVRFSKLRKKPLNDQERTVQKVYNINFEESEMKKNIIRCHFKASQSEYDIQSSSVTQSYPTLCNPMDWGTPGFPVHHQILKLAQTNVHRVGDATQPSDPLSSLSPPAFSLSHHQGLFQWLSYSHQVNNYWSISFSIGTSKEYSSLISFRMDWLDLLAFQGTLKSLLKYHTSKRSIFLHSAFIMVQHSHSFMTTWKIWRMKWQPTPVFLPGKSHW